MFRAQPSKNAIFEPSPSLGRFRGIERRPAMVAKILILPLLLLAAGAAPVQPPAPAAEPAVTAPPPPAFAADMPVVDRTGFAVGRIKSLADSPRGPMVVVVIDGKLVNLPQRTLTLTGGTAHSSQSKAEMLAIAGAPR
jgi:hypothetical protein